MAKFYKRYLERKRVGFVCSHSFYSENEQADFLSNE